MVTGHLSFCGGYVVLLGYSLYAKVGVRGLRIYCMYYAVMVMTTGHSSVYYILGVVWSFVGECGMTLVFRAGLCSLRE